jgi:Cu(I)/Ag(I) efflux system membrane fusion protein
MKNSTRNTVIIAAITLLAGLLSGGLIFGGGSEEAATGEHVHETEQGAETTWTCSMHPQIRQTEPGDCPICGMDLIPLESEGESDLDPAALSMSETAMKLADVVSAPAQLMQPVKNVRLNGKVEADERLIYSQSSHIAGRIEQLLVNFTGEYVREGQTIARIYSPVLVTAQEELFEAEKIRDTQPALFQAARDKLLNWKLTESQVDKILSSGEIREVFPVTADVSGYVTKKMVNLGDYIARGETIYEIADLSRVWVMFEVYETDIAWVSKNDSVEFKVQSLPGRVFEEKISYIDPVIDPQTRVAKARVSMRNPGSGLKPGMFTSGIVEAQLDDIEKALVVPESAVMWTGTRSVVFVKQTTDQGVNFTLREVTLGPSLGDGYIIEQGLEPGEEIAVNGTFSIDAAAQLAGKPSMMNPGGTAAGSIHDHGEPMAGNKMSVENNPQKASANGPGQLKTEKFKVYGNCGMCEDRIEKAANSVDGVSSAVWDKKTMMIEVKLDASKTDVHKVHMAIAEVGHDTEMHKARDEVYNRLPDCCKYDRPDAKKGHDHGSHEGQSH